jgi:ATP-dependent RNA helicase DDX23/PRP28
VPRVAQGGVSCATIHGGKSQDQRETALETFKRKQADVLVATDVIGRGIDIEGVEHVIQARARPRHAVPQTRAPQTRRRGPRGLARAPASLLQVPRAYPRPRLRPRASQYDLAGSIEAYTHRIGRTGRAGRKGLATTFVTGEGAERELLFDLKKKLEDCKMPVPHELARHEAAQTNPKDAGPDDRGPKPRIQYAKK